MTVGAKFTPKEAIKAFQLLISLGVRLLIASSTRSGVIEETLAKTANKIYSDKTGTAQELKKDISGITPSNEMFRQAFENATVSDGPLARYYLRTLERVAKREPDPLFTVNEDKEVVTLEHILPKKPEGNWPQFTSDEAETYSKRIGNLVLLLQKPNSDLKNAPWSKKRPHFRGHGYILTAQVGDASDWNVEAICKRQAELAKLALKAWPI
jgi:hypothetical protein